jgi:tetraacyldisaccharide 4'-kinase
MSVLSHVFGAAVHARNALYDREILRKRRLQAPVISVGNLSVGGSGKTPFVILLGEILKERGISFDVLSRGYGRRSCGTRVVDPNGSPREFGDEPLLIARRLGVHVIVGESRYEAGVCAERMFGASLHVLDDGFQHRSLARDFDIVLVTPEDASGKLLPAGRLREPLSALQRADAIVLTGDARLESISLQDKLVWHTRRGVEIAAAPSRPLVFCGVARPQVFVLQLKARGIEPVETRFFRDHHTYNRHDVESLAGLAKENSANGFITTEKDAVNLGELQQKLQPLTIARATMELENEADPVNAMLRVIAERRPGHEKIS